MLLVTNGRVITRDADNAYLENGAVAIDGERIAEVGDATALAEKYPDAEVVDAHGGVIMPGLVNCPHPHLLRPGPWPVHQGLQPHQLPREPRAAVVEDRPTTSTLDGTRASAYATGARQPRATA